MSRTTLFSTITAAAAAAAVLLASPQAADAGNDVLWHVPPPPSSTYSTDYSVVVGAPFPYDVEIADDFEATGLVQSLVVPGRGCSACSPFVVEGVYVRLYEWTAGGPGALQDEVFVTPASGFSWDGTNPYTLYITLPQPIQVSGWHFISVQVAFDGFSGGGVWNFVQNNRFNPVNFAVQRRDNLAGGAWSQDVDADFSLTLYGEASAAQPVVDALSRTTVTPSDRIIVNGSGFGAPGDGELLVNGLPAIVTTWSSTQIIGYVPEGVSAGPASLAVVNLGVTGDPFPITIIPRTPNGRVLWVFEGANDFTTFAPVTGPDGTIYFDDIDGLLYALTPDGGLKWIVDALLGQQGGANEGPLAVGADGTIYIGTNPLGPPIKLVAFNPDGSHEWTASLPPAVTWQAGPSIGPDGRIYGALNATQGGDDVFAVNTDGSIAWSSAASPFIFEDAAPGSAVAFGPSSPGGPIDQMMFTADRNGDGRNWGFDIADGDQNFAVAIAGGNDVGQTQLVSSTIGSGAFYMMEFSGLGGLGWGLQAFDADGDRAWRWDPGIASGATHPAVGPDGTIYLGWDLGRLSAVTPQGQEIWTHFQPVIYEDPAPSPTADLLLAIAREGYSEPSFMEGRDTTDGSVLWSQPLVDDEGGDIAPFSGPRFTDDGQAAYFVAIEAGTTPGSVMRVFAIDTSSNDAPLTGDVNGDGRVNVDDLVEVITAWGPCAGCPADVNGDGAVNVDDLVAVIVNWG